MRSKEEGGIQEEREDSGVLFQSRGPAAELLHPSYHWPFSTGGTSDTLLSPEAPGMEEASQTEQENFLQQASFWLLLLKSTEC